MMTVMILIEQSNYVRSRYVSIDHVIAVLSIDRRNLSYAVYQTSRSDGSDASDRMSEMRNDQDSRTNIEYRTMRVHACTVNREWRMNE